MDVKNVSIDKIGLSRRSQNALHRANVHTVGDLLLYTEDSLSEIRNLGKKSIEEIIKKIEEYKALDETAELAAPKHMERPENFNAWIREKVGREYVLFWLQDKAIRIDILDLLSTWSYNLLMLNGYEYLYQVVFLEKEELMRIPKMDQTSADEIIMHCRYYLEDISGVILNDYSSQLAASLKTPVITIFDMLVMPEYHDTIYKYVKENDRNLCHLGLSNRPVNCLRGRRLEKMSDIIFMTRSELHEIPSMGVGSVEEVMTKINDYLTENEARIKLTAMGDESALIDDQEIRNRILKIYQDIGFGGLSLNEMTNRLQLPDSIKIERIKKIIGRLLAANELEYVDFRCYRVYGKFADYLVTCPYIDERSRDFIFKRLQGITLDGIAQDYGLTRERVRQIVKKNAQKVVDWYYVSTGKMWFDEDYFRYFYNTYAFDRKDAIEWFGMSDAVCNYLDMMDVKRGKEDLQAALEDTRGLDAGLRLKIKNYLNRSKLFVDGMWVTKRRADLEELVIRKFCREDVSFDEFTKIYNEFLKHEEIAFDENIYYTEAVNRTRKNRLADARFLLWKQNERIRYYDIEGRDFTELLDTLNLESYENIEISTMKFVEDYPDILNKYDIRDQYELHNLLRKIVPEGSYHDFHCSKMPIIRFGEFDRDGAILDIIIDHAPISTADLCDFIHAEYGYDQAVIQGSYLNAFAEYYHRGVYSIDQKAMSPKHRDGLKLALPDDFYYINEIREIYHRLFPDADLEEVNSYNLKLMGFTVYSRYVVQNHASLEAYFNSILTREDIIDLTPYRKRFVYVSMFSQKLMELKRNLRIVEFEPNQIINFRKLERGGVTRTMIQDYCNAVFDFVYDEAYFSVQSIKQDGFESELFALGFSDWFYANLLVSDSRFSTGMMFGNIILYKGCDSITIKSFEMNRIKEYGSIDTYDLMTELEERFGCRVANHMEVVYKVQGTEIYYDRILDRLYASADTYYRELDEMEDI